MTAAAKPSPPARSPGVPETVETDATVVACDGGGGGLGHPRVFLNMGPRQSVDCPYCGRRYVLKAGAGTHGAH